MAQSIIIGDGSVTGGIVINGDLYQPAVSGAGNSMCTTLVTLPNGSNKKLLLL